MATLVEQIQRDASNSSVPVATLLRRAKVAASKLQLRQVENWIEHELDGYAGVDVPNYRKISGRLMGWNPYNGWIPIVGELPEMLSEMDIRQALESLEDLVRGDKGGGIHMPLPSELARMLDEHASIQLGRYAVHFSRGHIINIINAVRNSVLDWALKLEQSGISGDEFSFSAKERSRAQEAISMISVGNIGSFSGNLGSGNTARDISASSINVNQALDLARKIRKYLPDLISDGVSEKDLTDRLELLEKEAVRSNPNQGILAAALSDIREIVSGAGGNLVATGILEAIKVAIGQ